MKRKYNDDEWWREEPMIEGYRNCTGWYALMIISGIILVLVAIFN